MTTRTKVSRRIVVLSRRKLAGLASATVQVVTSRADVERLLAEPAGDTVWVEHLHPPLLRHLVRTLAGLDPVRRRHQRLLALSTWEGYEHAAFSTAFGRAVSSLPNALSPEELVEALAAPFPAELCLGGYVDARAGFVTLIRGDLSALLVPLETFEPTARGLTPDFSAFEVRDGGQTLGFGAYEAAFDAVLYELDSTYRARIRKQREANDRSLGASIRRLRKQRRLPRTAFSGVSERTLGRIERGEIATPHARTLDRIARTLRVPVDALGSY